MTVGENQEKEKRNSDSAEYFMCRAEAMLRAIYYAYKDAELTGQTSHESLETNVNSLLYNIFKAEDAIKKQSTDNPVKRPPVHGLERKHTEQLISSLNRTYQALRSAAKTRYEKSLEKQKKTTRRK